MKFKNLFTALMAGAIFASACEKNPEPEPLPEQSGYTGTLSVVEIGDRLFTLDDVRADYTLDSETGRLDIYMYEVSFSSSMPIRLNVMLLPDIPYTKGGSALSLSGTGIVPMMEMRGEMIPYEQYTCTDLTGTITPETMTLSMQLGGFQTDYSGSAED